MPVEIERKFLLKSSDWKLECDAGTAIKQGYLNSHKERTVRVRIKGDKGYLTIKGKTENIARQEFEYEIPVEEAVALIQLCEKPVIEKTRYLVKRDNLTWEIDVFEGENQGLEIAEVELTDEGQALELPAWIGAEVSHDARYFNASLISNPFQNWKGDL